MDLATIRSGAAFSLALAVIGGCESTATHAPYVDNPLLQARQPLLQSPAAASADPTRVASSPRMVVVPPPGLYAPQQQASPASVASAQPVRYNPAAPMNSSPTAPISQDAGPTLPPMLARAEPTPAHPAPTPPVASPLAAPIVPPSPMPAVATTPATPVLVASMPVTSPAPITPVADHKVEGKYGHAADYTWLQGELDRHYRGHLELRYRSVSEDDPYGGKVRLEDDPRLAQFRPGDIIMVQGELLTDPDGPNAAPWAQYRRYHVRDVRLVERK
jgi:hypothetical protein